MTDRYERLDYAERWLRDGLRVCEAPGFFEAIEVDMIRSKNVVERLRQSGIKGTYTHLLVRAVAIALLRHPELHKLVAGTQRLYPGQVDIGLSVAGNTIVAPTMVLEDAGRKNLRELATEIIKRTPEIRKQEMQMLTHLQKWGWLVPFGWLRRWILRFLLRQFWFRRQGVGTFQISCVANVDLLVPFMFNTSAILGVGRVRDRVVAIDNQPVVRPTLILACCVDHKVWDGVGAAKFLTELNRILESGELEQEV